jgi:hypothetical protein
MRGRWAAGIVPRNFAWIIKDRLAVSERPGGQAPYHRRVRRQEEILWLRAQHFTRVVSLLGSNHNLHAYDELGMTASHFPIGPQADLEAVLAELYPALHAWLRAGERVLLHQEELGDRLAGVIAGFLCWSRLLPEPPRAITAAEQLMRRQLGAAGRTVVAVAVTLRPPELPASPAPFGPMVTSAGVPAAGDYPPPAARRGAAAAAGGGTGGPPPSAAQPPASAPASTAAPAAPRTAAAGAATAQRARPVPASGAAPVPAAPGSDTTDPGAPAPARSSRTPAGPHPSRRRGSAR